MSKHKGVPQMDPFDQTPGNDVTTVTNEIYGLGGNSKLETGRVVAQPIRIEEIWADVTQPRRSVPTSVRRDWDGGPDNDNVAALFTRWKDAVMYELGTTFGVKGILEGDENPFVEGLYSSVVEKFEQLVRLAGDIHDTQLNQPIGITPRDDGGYLIVFGERRWLAYHLLNMVYPDDKYQRIAARVLDNDAFNLAKSQASENMARSDLNAISKSRQLAKLVIVANQEQGATYQTYSDLVQPGGCDRRYYAQVRDGNEHSIPRNMGPKFEQALNISTGQMRKYRMLLSMTDDDELNDAIWTAADDGDWAERFIRDVGGLNVQQLRNAFLNGLYRSRGNAIDLQNLEKSLRKLIEQANQPKPTPATSQVDRAMPSADRAEWPHDEPTQRVKFQSGDRVQLTTTTDGPDPLPAGMRGKVTYMNNKIGVLFDGTRFMVERRMFDGEMRSVLDFCKKENPVQSRPLPPMTTNKWRIGDWVETRTGRVGKVVGMSGRYANVQDANGIRQHDQDTLERAEESAPPFRAGERVVTKGGNLCRVYEVKPDGKVMLQSLEEPSSIWLGDPSTLRKATAEDALADSPTPSAGAQEAMLQHWVGKRVRSRYAGWEGTVIRTAGDHLVCRKDDGNSFTLPPDRLIVIDSPEMDLRTEDERATDNASSAARAVPLLDDQPEHIRQLVYNLRGLAIGLGERRVQKHIDQLIAMTNVDMASEAGMTADVTKATLTDYANDIAHLLENAQQTFEGYLEWIGQAVDELREDGA